MSNRSEDKAYLIPFKHDTNSPIEGKEHHSHLAKPPTRKPKLLVSANYLNTTRRRAPIRNNTLEPWSEKIQKKKITLLQ